VSTADGHSEIDTDIINDPTVEKNELGTRQNASAHQCAEQAEKEADRLRVELSEVKQQLENAEMATAKVVDELLSSKRELNAARDVEFQLSMQIEALVKELEGSATAVENAAERAEADLATLRWELEAMRSILAGKISELNEMKPQLDLARMQLRILQETYASSCSPVETAEMHAHHADEELALVKAEFGPINNLDINQSSELVPADTGQLLARLNKEHLLAEQISKLEAELESAQNAQAVMQDAWWMMKEPNYNILDAENRNRALRRELVASGSKLALAPSSNQALKNGDTWVWEVFYGSGVNIRAAKSLKTAIIGSKDAGMVVCGRQEWGWVALTEEPGFIKISDSGRILLRKVQLYFMVSG